MGLFSYTTPEGERRRWTFKQIVQGYPLGEPSHPLFVHFPVALYTFALVLDVISVLWDFPAAPLAATWAILGAFVGSFFAVITGLTDYLGMARGSRIKRVATRHMLLQFTAAAVFIVNFLIRWGDRTVAEAEPVWIVLDVIGVGIMLTGAYLGGHMVYRLGMRVSTAEEAPRRTPPA
jgi:uncharacterized membrane protein